MALDGDIKTFSISAVGRMIHSENKTGVLKVKSGEYATSIYFKNGEIVFISGDPDKDISIGSLLKADNLISEEDIRKSLKIAKETGKRLGVVLLEQGLISQKKLVNILRNQFIEMLAGVLGWEQGFFNYSDGLSGYTEDIRLAIDPIRLVAEAQRWQKYRNLIPNDNVIFQIKAGDFKPDLLSGDSASRVMLLIDGKRSVARITSETGLSRLAVYRTLAALVSRGAITSEGGTNAKIDPGRLNNVTIIKFYLNLLNELTAGLAVELGRQKAGFLLEKSLKRTPGYDLFFSAFQPVEDAATNLDLIHNHIRHQKKSVLQQDLVNGFNLAVLNLLQEEYQLLGLKASQNTANRAQAALELVPGNQKPLARTLSRFLNQVRQDEDLLQGARSLPQTLIHAKKPPSEKKQPLPAGPDKIGGASIIAFYSMVVQMLITDLEQEIGAKASDLLQDAVMNSEYYAKFLSQFDISDSIGTNVKRISNYIGTRGFQVNNQDMVVAFQQVFATLLQAENRLLGNKAVRMSLFKIREHVTSPACKNYKPLADLFVTFLKNTGLHK